MRSSCNIIVSTGLNIILITSLKVKIIHKMLHVGIDTKEILLYEFTNLQYFTNGGIV